MKSADPAGRQFNREDKACTRRGQQGKRLWSPIPGRDSAVAQVGVRRVSELERSRAAGIQGLLTNRCIIEWTSNRYQALVSSSTQPADDIQTIMQRLVSLDGKPAKVSCIHGCTRVHEIYFRAIEPNSRMRHFELRPGGDKTCVFELSV